MVLQRDQALTLRGEAEPGALVRVQLESTVADGMADAQGRWTIALPARSAGGPYELRVISGDETVTLTNVLIGEVWVCSGQSNMEATVQGAPDAAEILGQADWPQVRLLRLPRIPHPVPPQHIDTAWQVASAKSAGDFSKVAFRFGLELFRALRVPIGLIDAARGGTVVEAWTPSEVLRRDPEMVPIVAAYEADLPRHAEALAAHREAMQAWKPLADPGNAKFAAGWADPKTEVDDWPQISIPCWWQYGGLRFHGAVWFRREIEIPSEQAGGDLTLHLGACDKTDTTYFNNVEVGSIPLDFPDGWRTPRIYKIPGSLVRPGRNTVAVRVFCNLNNAGMTGPASGMKLEVGGESLPLAGLWRFQVEHNLGWIQAPLPPWGPGNANSPSILFNSLIGPLTHFRIGGVIWYQGESNEDNADRYARLFPAMIRGWRTAWGQGDFPFLFVQLPNFGPEEPVHTLWAELREAQEAGLGEPMTAMVPTIDIGDPNDLHPANKEEVGRRLSLAALAIAYRRSDPSLLSPRVDSVTSLEGKVRVTVKPSDDLLLAWGREPVGFEIAGDDGSFVPALARIEGSEIVLWNPSVPAPVQARYAWANNPRTNIANRKGLPLAPFRQRANLTL